VIERRLAAANQTALGTHIVGRLASERHALAHAMLAALPVREAVTTNYDRLLELAAAGIGSRSRSFPARALDARAAGC
jgi:hypothetical protein